jgi:hypothetical protein
MNDTVTALIIFVDIRGFSAWSEKVENFNFLDEFSARWYSILNKRFKQEESNIIKFLGDGAMIIHNIEETLDVETLSELITSTLFRIQESTTDFTNLCEDLSIKKGSKIPLVLGWGVVRGDIKQCKDEFIGAELNKCSRYCDIARPHGIVLDAVDFSEKVIPNDGKFFKQSRKLPGIGESDVWVTKEIYSQFLKREDLRQSPEVHVAGICFKKEGEKYFVLLGKRAKTRKLYPGLYEGCGGQLAANESFTSGVKRHYILEYGIDICVFEDIHTFYSINVANNPLIPGVLFLCEYISGKPQSANHDFLDWIEEDQFNKMEESVFIPGVKNRIKCFFGKYKNQQ